MKKQPKKRDEKAKKLSIKAETVRDLTPTQLKSVAGGWISYSLCEFGNN